MTPPDPKKTRRPHHTYVDVPLDQVLLWGGVAVAATLFVIQVPTYISWALVLLLAIGFTIAIYTHRS